MEQPEHYMIVETCVRSDPDALFREHVAAVDAPRTDGPRRRTNSDWRRGASDPSRLDELLSDLLEDGIVVREHTRQVRPAHPRALVYVERGTLVLGRTGDAVVWERQGRHLSAPEVPVGAVHETIVASSRRTAELWRLRSLFVPARVDWPGRPTRRRATPMTREGPERITAL